MSNIDPDRDWNEQIIEEFRANGGKVGGPFEGAPMVLVHNTGAKSGTERVTPLMYQPGDDGRIYIFASAAGATTNPDWFHNLKADPDVTIEVGTETVPARARILEGQERAEVWAGPEAGRAAVRRVREDSGRPPDPRHRARTTLTGPTISPPARRPGRPPARSRGDVAPSPAPGGPRPCAS